MSYGKHNKTVKHSFGSPTHSDASHIGSSVPVIVVVFHTASGRVNRYYCCSCVYPLSNKTGFCRLQIRSQPIFCWNRQELTSMAAATMSATDLGAQSSLPVRLGASIAKPDRKSRWSSVRYNHKPRLEAGKTVDSRLQAGKEEEERILALKQGEDEWRYSGRRRAAEETYVLVLGMDGKKECTLERLDEAYAMNLIQTPKDKDADHLAQQLVVPANNETSRVSSLVFFGSIRNHDLLYCNRQVTQVLRSRSRLVDPGVLPCTLGRLAARFAGRCRS